LLAICLESELGQNVAATLFKVLTNEDVACHLPQVALIWFSFPWTITKKIGIHHTFNKERNDWGYVLVEEELPQIHEEAPRQPLVDSTQNNEPIMEESRGSENDDTQQKSTQTPV
jgi:hypothetical protein